MKKLTRFILNSLIACMCFTSLAGCGSKTPGVIDKPSSQMTVTLTQDAQHYAVTSQNPVKTEKNQQVRFDLTMKSGFCVDEVTYRGERMEANIINKQDGSTTVIISNISYSVALQLTCNTYDTHIAYYPNGGSYRLDGDSSMPYIVGCDLTHRLRPNTALGNDVLVRQGYVLNGWNTEPDGTGERVGLGSRATVTQGATTALYAQWEVATAQTEFDYQVNDGKATVTKYKGTQQRVVVPEELQGSPVVEIGAQAFGGNIQEVVLPSTVKTIKPQAFDDCRIHDLYLYDNITSISDAIFNDCENFTSLHFNAFWLPRHGKNDLYSEINLADKYDILMLNADKNKVIIFGGSGAYISVDTKQMELDLQEEGEDYVCINMAVNGWFNGAAQFDMMMPFLHEGDIFIHVPESSSQFTFMYEVSMLAETYKFDYNKLRLYYCLESNLDLISLIDYHHVTDLLNGFSQFNLERVPMKSKAYTDYLTEINLLGTIYQRDMGYIDDRGGWNLPRIAQGNSMDSGEADMVPEYIIKKEAHERLNAYYDAMTEKGVIVALMPAPINRNTLQKRLDGSLSDSNNDYLFYGRPWDIPLDYDSLLDWASDYDLALSQYLHATILSSIVNVMYLQSDFFDADYHLSDDKVPVYTRLITAAIVQDLLD